MTRLVIPSQRELPEYIAALKRGWSPDTIQTEKTAKEHLKLIEEDADAFLARMTDPEAKGPRVVLPDGKEVERLPGFMRWVWDETLCGAINFRWAKGTSQLPPHVLGHIGFSTVPWALGKGYATKALALLLPLARAEGLAYVELTTDPDNIASQKVITANGGELVEEFKKPDAFGGSLALKYQIELN